MTKPVKKGILGGVELIGISFTDVGKSIFGGVHMTGAAILKAFGAGSTANALEKTEANAGLLPSWAQTPKAVTQVAVVAPDFVVVVPAPNQSTGKTGKTAVFVADSVMIYGGTRFDGNGYKPGDGLASKKISFGYTAPSKLVATYKGQSTPYDNIAQVMFLGGTEGQPQTTTSSNTAQGLLDDAGQVAKVALTYKASTAAAPASSAQGSSSSMQLAQPTMSAAQAAPASSSPSLSLPASSPSVANYQLTAPTLSGDELGRQIVGELEAADAVGMSGLDILENVFTGGAVYTSEAVKNGIFPGGGGGAGPVNYNFNTDPTKFHPQAYTPSAYASGQLSTAASRLASLQQQLAQAQQQRAQQSMAQMQSAAPIASTFSPPAPTPMVLSQSSAQPLPASSTGDSSTSDDSGNNSTVLGRSADMGRNKNYEVLGRDRDGIDYKTINDEGAGTLNYDILGAGHARSHAAAVKAAKHIVGADDDESGFGEPYVDEIVGGGSAPTNTTNPYLKGTQVLGAISAMKLPQPGARLPGVPSVGYKAAVSPVTGRQFTTVHIAQPATGKKPDPKTSIANARTIAKRATSDAAKIKASVANLSGASKPSVTSSIVSAVKNILGSDDDGWVEIVGAAAARVGRKPAMTVAQIQAAADKLKASAGDLNTQADKHEKLLNAFNAKQTAGIKKIQTITNPRASVGIKGDTVLGALHGHRHAVSHANAVLGADYLRALDDAMIHSHNTIVGQAYPGYPTTPTYPTGTVSPYGTTDTSPPNPANPGYLMDGTVDPNYGSTSSTSTLPGPPDYGLGSPPTSAPALVSGLDYTPDPGAQGDTNVYSSTGSGVPLPIGAVLYTDDGSHPMGTKSVGSYGYFYQGVPGAKSRDGAGSGYIVRGVKNGVLNWKAYVKSANANNDKSLGAAEAADLPTMAANSVTNGWGPIIGNPQDPNFKGLRLDVGGNAFFWYRDTAPAWATAADTQNRYQSGDHRLQVGDDGGAGQLSRAAGAGSARRTKCCGDGDASGDRGFAGAASSRSCADSSSSGAACA